MFEKHVFWEEIRAQTNTFPWNNFPEKGLLTEFN